MITGKTIKVGNQYFMTDFFILHPQSGLNELSFRCYKNENAYSECVVETPVIYQNQRFTIKLCDENSTYTDIECILDLDDFKADIIDQIGSDDDPVQLTLEELFLNYLPAEWKYEIENTSEVKAEWNAKDLTFKDIIEMCVENYGVYFDIDNINKIIKVYYVGDIQYDGMFVTEQLNIISSNVVIDSYGLFTRLYPYGQDEDGNRVTIESVNNGLPYIENRLYSNSIISKVVEDNDISDPSELLQKAQITLENGSTPTSSYTFRIAKLRKGDYALGTIGINKLVKYIDRRHKLNVMHRIVEYKEYPNTPMNDEITLSKVVTTIEDSINSLSNSLNGSLDTLSANAKETLNIINNFFGSGNIQIDKNRILIMNKIPKDEATGIIMFDRFGMWWNSTYSEHVINENGEISSTSWKKLFDIKTGNFT